MPTIPSTVEIPIGRFVKYVAIIFIAGTVFGAILGVTGVTTNWPRSLAGALWQFFIIENPVITALALGIPSVYLVVKWRRNW